MLTLDGRSDLALGTKHNSLESTLNGTINSMTSSPTAMKSPPSTRHRHMWVVTGPAGCGKSTVAGYLSEQLSIDFIEGDDYHPKANKDKMSGNTPLTDQDRWDWLIALRESAMNKLSPTATCATRPHTGVVVTCSALKRKYRDVIRIAAYIDHGVRVHFIYLHATEEVLLKRVAAREGHYMGPQLVHSQFECLEEPGETECKMDVLPVDCSGNKEKVEAGVIAQVRRVLEKDSGI